MSLNSPVLVLTYFLYNFLRPYIVNFYEVFFFLLQAGIQYFIIFSSCLTKKLWWKTMLLDGLKKNWLKSLFLYNSLDEIRRFDVTLFWKGLLTFYLTFNSRPLLALKCFRTSKEVNPPFLAFTVLVYFTSEDRLNMFKGAVPTWLFLSHLIQ